METATGCKSAVPKQRTAHVFEKAQRESKDAKERRAQRATSGKEAIQQGTTKRGGAEGTNQKQTGIPRTAPGTSASCGSSPATSPRCPASRAGWVMKFRAR